MKPRKLLIIQTAFIGDVILGTPVADILSQQYPDCEIHFLVKKNNESVLLNHPAIHKIHSREKGTSLWNKCLSFFKLIRELRKEKYDAIINLHRFLSSGLITLFVGAPLKIGFNKNPLSIIFTYSFPHEISEKGSTSFRHEVHRNLSLCKPLLAKDFFIHINSQKIRPCVFPSEKDFETINPYIHKINSDGILSKISYIVIAPSSVWFTKQLPQEKWVELLKNIDPKISVFIIGAKSDYSSCEAISEKFPNCMNLSGKLTLLQSAALMKNAIRVYCNDSAPLHLASAMNAPVTVFFCSTAPFFGFGPLSDDSFIIERNDLDCRPCGLHGFKACPLGHFKCGYPDLDKC